MTLGKWLQTNLRRVTFDPEYTAISPLNGSEVTVTVNPVELELSYALVSSPDEKAFTVLASQLILERCKEKVRPELPDGMYSSLLSKAKHALTSQLIRSDGRFYRKWLDILERRDPSNWSPKKEVKANVTGNAGNAPISISFQVV